MRRRFFLLSPARFGGKRTSILLREEAEFELAVKLREGGATLGEVYAFLSGLYFRGKLAYAAAFGEALIIAPGAGLLPPNTPLDISRLRELGSVPVDEDNHAFRQPLIAAATAALERSPESEFVLLGSVASDKYTEPLLSVLGPGLLFPSEFVGRGDMSRGGLMLRCASSGTELEYVTLDGAVRHGKRPPKLKPLS